VWLVGDVQTAIDLLRVVAKKNADSVFLSGYLSPQLRQVRLGRVQKLLCLPSVG
jgi:hypothetical protein